MDDTERAWPAWKFGLRQDDLKTTLHERYNTFTFALQDPEAFHHDVYELSRDADTLAEFHGLMAARREQRLLELKQSLQALAVEIVANPKLMADEQWQHALQLFRTQSYDSMVRYFASYVPNHYVDRHDAPSSTSGFFSDVDSVDTLSTGASSSDDVHCSLFLDEELFPDDAIVTVERCTLGEHDLCSDGPPSPPRSDTMGSESSVSSPSDIESRSFSSTNPPSRSMSFSGSESGHIVTGLLPRQFGHRGDGEACPLDGGDVGASARCGSDGARPAHSGVPEAFFPPSQPCTSGYSEDDEFPCAQHPEDQFDHLDAINTWSDSLESDTPTPRQDSAAACCYLDLKRSARRSSPSRQRLPSPKLHLACQQGAAALDVRRSPEEALSKVQKPMPDALRTRPKGRRRAGC